LIEYPIELVCVRIVGMQPYSLRRYKPKHNCCRYSGTRAYAQGIFILFYYGVVYTHSTYNDNSINYYYY